MKYSSSQPSKPRICLLTESYYPIIGGGETQTRITAEDLVANGFEVMVVTRQTNPDFATFEKMGDISIYRVPPQGTGHLKRWVMLTTVLPFLIQHRHRFDVILVSSYRVLGVAAVLVGQLFGKPCILKADNNGEMSGAFFAGGLKKWNLTLSSWPVQMILGLRNRLFKRATSFISISSDITQELSEAGIPADKIQAIPNSVDTTRFCPVSPPQKADIRQQLGLPPDDKIVVYTGRLMTTKGLPLLIQVWNELRCNTSLMEPPARLLIVGGSSKEIYDCEAYLKNYVFERQMEDSVIFTGNVNNVDEYLKAADIFVFPTEEEAFGISMIEAMACGLAVISTPVGGLKDIITPEHNGLFIEVGNAEQLKRAIATLIANPAQATALGRQAVKTVEQRYSREAIAQQYVELFSRFSQ